MKLEESYFQDINRILAPQFEFNIIGKISGIELPINMTNSERRILLSYLWKIEVNRKFIYSLMTRFKKRYTNLGIEIDKELKSQVLFMVMALVFSYLNLRL